MIPVWGSGRAAIDDFQNDEWAAGCFNAALACSDAIWVKSLVTGLGKGALKLGSHSWGATRAWYGTTRSLEAGTPVHHWLLERGSSVGRRAPDLVKNQPPNLMPMTNQALHMAVHGSRGPFRVWYGTPLWAKALWLSLTGRGLEVTAEMYDE
jgi:hypothetical protein